MTKRILSVLILTFILITSSFSALALEDYKELNALGVMPNKIYAKTDSELVTRSELACITAKIMDNSDRAAMDTRFCDVDASNEYSGYIEFLADAGVINGTGGCAFIPDGNVTTDVANKMLLSAIGYGALCEEIGGYPEGYRTIARALSLNKGVKALEGGNLTAEAIAVMVTNLLETPLPSIGISIGDSNSELTEKDTSVLGNMLGISVYEGKITGIDNEADELTFVCADNVYTSNPVKIAAGQSLTLGYTDYDKVQKYENVPCVVYVDENKDVLYIEEAEGVEIFYKVIDSVNGDRNTLSKYSVTNMKQITFLDDEEVYDVAPDAELKYNNVLTHTSVKLIGNTAKVVTVDDEVVYIESWDFNEGGLITDKTSEEITYQSGEKSGSLLSELHLIDNKVVIIDGVVSNYEAIKKNSVFDYYKGDNFIALTVSEKIVSETFEGVGNGSLDLGYITYDTKDVYYSRDGVSYKKNYDYAALLNIVVNAYISPDGYVRYVTPAPNQSVTSDKFYGIVSGFNEETFNSDAQMQIWMIGDKITRQIFKVSKNIKLNDGITVDSIRASAGTFDGSSLYVFETLPGGAILSVSLPKPLYGFEGVTPYFSDPLTFVGDGGRIFYPTGKFVAMFTENGEFKVDYAAQSSLKGLKEASDYKFGVSFYSDEGDLDLSLSLITGDMSRALGMGDSRYGLLTQKKSVLSTDGETMTRLTFLVAGGTEEYVVSNETAKGINPYSLVSYYVDPPFTSEEIRINSNVTPINLSGSPDMWQEAAEGAGWYFGYIDKINDERIALTDGNTYSFYPNLEIYAEYDDSDTKEPFKPVNAKYIREGDYIYYCTFKVRGSYDSIISLIVIR